MTPVETGVTLRRDSVLGLGVLLAIVLTALTPVSAAAQTGAISGTITDGSAAPLAFTGVVIYSSNGSEAGFGFTDNTGFYLAQNLPPGTYFAVTQSQTHVNEVYDNIPCQPCNPTTGIPIVVSTGATTPGINFALTSGGAMTGVLTNAVTGLPIVNSFVSVYNAHGRFVKGGSPDQTGTFVVSGLLTGSYFAVGGATDFIWELYAGTDCFQCDVTTGTPIVVTVGTTQPNINFSLAVGGSLQGTVSDAVTSQPINGDDVEIEMHLYSASGVFLDYTYVSDTGTYAFPRLPTGSYRLRTFNFGGYIDEVYNDVPCAPCVISAGSAISVTAGAATTGVNFALQPGGRISGRVTQAGTGTPMQSVLVKIFASNGAWVTSAETDSAGDYVSWAGLPAGTYFARTFAPSGFLDEIYDDDVLCFPSCVVTSGTGIDVSGVTTISGIDFALSPTTELLQNGDFVSGLQHWSMFATPDTSYIVVNVSSGVDFYRVPPPPGTSNQAVVFQQTGTAVAADVPVLAQFDLENTSDVRKRITVIVHDLNFSDLAACTFWLPARSFPARYGIRARTTKAWTNATLSFYAASPGSQGGFYRLDNASMQAAPFAAVQRTDCLDPLSAAPPPGADGPDLLINGDFSSGSTAPGWITFGTLTLQVTSGVLEFIRPTNVPPAGVILQSTNQAVAAGEILTATFELGNSSAVRKRVSLLLHDSDFSDLSVCTFWVEPGQPLEKYAYRAITTKAWANATLSVYPATIGPETWIRFDNATLRTTPQAGFISGVECLEPGSTSFVPAGRREVNPIRR